MKGLLIRSTSLCTAALWAVLVGLSNAAAQQECNGDSDCGENQHCKFEDMVCANSDAAQPGEEPPEPDCWAEGPGICVTDCRDDSDCEEGFQCEIHTLISLRPCLEGMDCPEPPQEEVSEPHAGTCEPAPISCETDADCPSPLVCELGDCPPSVSGDTSEDCAAATRGECIFELAECASDADCNAGYECAVMEGLRRCSVDVAAPMPDCAAGTECPMPMPEPSEPECEPVEQRMCFPKEVPCDTDGDCDDGWSCFDFSSIRDMETEDGYLGPPWWSKGEPGVAVACMPHGLIAVFEGHADAEGSNGSESLGTSGYDANSSEGEPVFMPGSAASDAPSAEEEQDADEEGGDEDDDGGCSIGRSGDASPSQMMAWGVLLALIVVRRRRRR